MTLLSSLHAGQQFARYELLEKISGGLFYEIWRAQPVRLNMKRMLLIPIHTEFADILRQVNVNRLTKLNHARIVKIIEINMDSDPPYVAMPNVEGTPLRSILDIHLTLQPILALEIVKKILETLIFAHQYQEFHASLSPDTIFISDTGEVHIINFGIGNLFLAAAAKIHEASSDIVLTDAIETRMIRYLSPEQLEDALAAQNTDLYSIGLMIGELLLGRIANEKMVPELTNQGFPDEITSIVKKCLLDADQRFRSPEEMLKAILIAISTIKKEHPEASPRLDTTPEIPPDDLTAESSPQSDANLEELPEKPPISSRANNREKKQRRIDENKFHEIDFQPFRTGSTSKRNWFLLFEIIIVLCMVSVIWISRKSGIGIFLAAIGTPTHAPDSTPTVIPSPFPTATATAATMPSASPQPTKTPAQPAVTKESQIGLNIQEKIGSGFIRIQPGVFIIGSPSGEFGRREDERQKTIQLTASIFIQKTEVTQEQWQQIMGTNPSSKKAPHYPVERITWHDSVIFCNALSKSKNLEIAYFCDPAFKTPVDESSELPQQIYWNRKSRGFRLPTEAEWEVACRAGTSSAYYWGDDWNCLKAMAENDTSAQEDKCSRTYRSMNIDPDSPAGTKSFPANPIGLFDIIGNVSEWCWDYYSASPVDGFADPAGPVQGELRIIRGGSWNHAARSCRSAARDKSSPDFKASFIGLRVAINAE